MKVGATVAPSPNIQRARWFVAVVIPLAAFAIQRPLWPLIHPFAWFLFYPAVFASSWLGGLSAGLIATGLSAGLAWFSFIPPEHALAKEDPKYFLSLAVFAAMGVVFSLFHDRLRRADRGLVEANEKLRAHDALNLLAAPSTGDAARRELDVVARNARTLLRHVDDLLDVAKLEAARMKADYAEADLARIVRFVAGHFEVLAQERKLAFTVDAPASVPAQVDPAKVQRVLLNVLANAFKFVPEGGRVRVSLRGAGDRARIEVGDSGRGIPPDKRAAVFDRFTQLEGGATRRFGGTGLGLTIARDFVLLHGGAIGVEDAPEGGALFVVELPLRAPQGEAVRTSSADDASGDEEPRHAVEGLRAAAAPKSAPEQVGAGAVVLVVEDNPEMNRFLCETLGEDHRVLAAFDGAEGLRKAVELAPDLIVTDVMMPELSGEDLVRRIREHASLDATPIVLLTAKADDELRVRVLREGAQDYLTKPFSVEELRARVDGLIARKRADERNRALSEELLRVTTASTAVSEAVAGMPESSVHAVLNTIVLHAQALTQAGCAAIGIGTDADKPFDPWVYVGIDPEIERAVGHPPRPVGTLGAVARGGQAVRLRDVRSDPRYGGVPPRHPEIRGLLGVPIRFRGACVGNLYMANKQGAAEFSETDERVLDMLAARAGVAIETARLYHAEGMGRAWLQSVIEQMPEGALLVDADGKVTGQNRALTALSCGDGSEIDPLGNPLTFDLRRPSGERVPAAELPHVRAVAKGESTSAEEFALRQSDGSMVPVLVSAVPIRGRNGEPAGASMVVQDISALKALERLRQEWASVVAHDLKQPLNAISLQAQILARARDREEESRAIESIRAATRTLSRMIGDLADASCIEARQMRVEAREMDLAQHVRDVVVRFGASDVEMRVAAGEPAVVQGDAVRIEQVLVNLLTNARKYGSAGQPIRVEVAPHDGEVEVTVTNRGPGIAASELQSLFGRFRRTDRARASRTPGLGLGLYISKGLVEAQHGRIWAESTEGETTAFHFVLPRAEMPRA